MDLFHPEMMFPSIKCPYLHSYDQVVLFPTVTTSSFTYTPFLAQSPAVQAGVAAFCLVLEKDQRSVESKKKKKKYHSPRIGTGPLIILVVISQLGCNKYIISRTATNCFLFVTHGPNLYF